VEPEPLIEARSSERDLRSGTARNPCSCKNAANLIGGRGAWLARTGRPRTRAYLDFETHRRRWSAVSAGHGVSRNP